MGFSPEVRPPPVPTEEHHFALRTLIRYIGTFHQKKPGHIAQGTKLTADEVENYINRPAKNPETLRKRFGEIYPRVRELLNDAKAPPLMSEVVPLANLLYSPSSLSRELTPISLEATDLRSWQTTNADLIDEVLGRIVGMWRVVRISTARWDDPEIPEFNVALLNVFDPVHRSALMPNCRLYTRGKHALVHNYHSIDAFILVRSNRFYISGHMSAADRYPFLLSLEYGSAERAENGHLPHLPITTGQLMSVNSQHLTISSYVIAEYIEGTAQLAPAEYESRKDAERSAIGVYPLNNIGQVINNKPLIERLLKWSKEDHVWIMKF